jgi:DNA-binding transcriptional regulator YiaG
MFNVLGPRTLQNWEQGHRRPEGTARALPSQ